MRGRWVKVAVIDLLAALMVPMPFARCPYRKPNPAGS